MKRLALVLSITVLLAACAAPTKGIDRIQAGMSPDQVKTIMGQPETVAHSPGKECAYYSVLKDFWSRVPWSLSEQYYVCYDNGRAATFGRVDSTRSG